MIVLMLLSVIGANAQSANEAGPLKMMIVPGPVPVVRVLAAHGQVHLPACRGVTWQQYDAEAGAWIVGSPPACGAISDAVPVGSTPVDFSAGEGLKKGDVIRPVFAVGIGCASEKPIALAKCKEFQTQVGPNVTVRGDPTVLPSPEAQSDEP